MLVETQGDANQSTPLHQMGGQGIFVKEVQRRGLVRVALRLHEHELNVRTG